MTFPSTVPANETIHREGRDRFIVKNGKWEHYLPVVFIATDGFDGADKIAGKGYTQTHVHDRTEKNMIKLSVAVSMSTDDSIKLAIYDASKGGYFSAGDKSYAYDFYAYQLWRDDSGENNTDFATQGFSDRGIRLNSNTGGREPKKGRPQMVDITIMYYSETETMIRFESKIHTAAVEPQSVYCQGIMKLKMADIAYLSIAAATDTIGHGSVGYEVW